MIITKNRAAGNPPDSDTEQWIIGNGRFGYGLIAEAIKYATIVVATAPILVLYPFLQKYFVKGMMVGSVKG